MAVWNLSRLSTVQQSFGRLDAEFYRPELMKAFANVTARSFMPLGCLVAEGYRVVYENTRILDPARIRETSVRFLQATNLARDGLSIDIDSIGYVAEQDWLRYPRGRICAGEILIEVKGQAEKVAVVPDNFPSRTLVSGSLFKLKTKPGLISPYYLFLFLSSRHGKMLRDRLKTNTLIGFVAVSQLYSIPVFLPGSERESELSCQVREALRLNLSARDLFADAQDLLEAAIGLDKLNFQELRGYTAQLSELESCYRTDAQHYQPQFGKLINHLSVFPTERVRNIRLYNRRGIQPHYVSDGSVRVINSQHLGASHLDYDAVEKTDVNSYAAAPEAHIQENDLLIYTTGAYVGRTNVYLSDAPAMASNHVNILRLRPDIDAAYMMLVLQSTIGQLQTQKHARGSAQAELYPADIDRFVVPLIDPDRQRAIGDLVRESLERRQKSRGLFQQAKSRVEQLIEEAAVGS